jgi:hypothetical protein
MIFVMGCSSLPKKFIRKKPAPEHTPAVVYLEQGPYQKKFSNEYYYKTHYTLWKTWQDEILDNLGGNSKKLQRSAEEAYNHLSSMSQYLKPESQAKLAPLVVEQLKLMGRFQDANYSKSEEASMKSDLERLKRLVANDFYYDKVKDDILPEKVDLGDAGTAAGS